MVKIEPVTKNHPNRERKKVILVGTEGKNKTEELYLRELEGTQKKYHFIFAAGNETDPVKITRNTIKSLKKEGLRIKNGDMALSMFDLDAKDEKRVQLAEAKKIAAKANVSLITSNPCFEIWYLEHLGYSSKAFRNSEEVIKQILKKMPEYKKNTCDFDKLYPLTDKAIRNCEKLELHHEKTSTETMHEFDNPRTDVYKIVKIIMEGNR